MRTRSRFGNVISKRDFMPFGEELYAGTASRTETNKYSAEGADNVRKRFTGYEKDKETRLDYAEARMYNNQHGRFTAVDPLLASGLSANPQTFNRYGYVANNPGNETDSTGMFSDKHWKFIEPGFWSPSWDDGQSVRFPRDFDALASFIRQTTTTYTITQKEYLKNDKTTPVTQQATIIVIRVVIEIIDVFGHVTSTDISYNSLARNSGVGGFRNDALDRMALTARRIVEVAYEKKRDVILFLAMAQRETHLGNGTNVSGKAEMGQMVNPLQLDPRSGIMPSATDWKSYISEAMAYFDRIMQEMFPNVKSKWNATLETKLQTYNGGSKGPNIKAAKEYSADVISMKGAIQVNESVERLDLFGQPMKQVGLLTI